MKRLSCKRVFSKYEVSLSDHLARFAYSLYKRTRICLSKKIPLKDHEKFLFKDHRLRDESSEDMPLGFNYIKKENEDGYINLEYIDFYDYLPKEDLDNFKKSLQNFILKNRPAPFGPFRAVNDVERIDSMGRYTDWRAFSNLDYVKLTHNEYLKQYSPLVAVSLRNLSPSFLVVKYRFYINSSFNEKFNEKFKTKYPPYTDVIRRINVPWYKPQKFGRTMNTGNDARNKEIYFLTANLKWKAVMELRRYFTIHFERNQLFPPTFETYSTNIRPINSQENKMFWNGVLLGYNTDYAPKYNACVSWEYKNGQYEGIKLSAYCGGSYSNSYDLAGFIQHEISDIYAVYMTASSIKEIAKRDIAICNKKINKAICKRRASSVLNARVQVKQKLYYSYRFISEFSGGTIDYDEVIEFKNPLYKNNSSTASCLKNISKSTNETKKQIDNLIHILDDAAEYVSTKSNLSLQWVMMLVTIMSLITAVLALIGFTKNDLKSLWDTINTLLHIK